MNEKPDEPDAAEQQRIEDENRRIRNLRRLADLTLQLLLQGDYSREEAEMMVERVRQMALRYFPGKEAAFELIYRPRFERILRSLYDDEDSVH